jgi:hypothetical protein
MRREADQKLNCTFMHGIRYPACFATVVVRTTKPADNHVLEQVARDQ